MWTRLAVAQFLTGSLLAGIVTANAVPALASPFSSARSAEHAVRITEPAATPRAFFGLGPASNTGVDGRPFFNWSATPGAGLTDHVAVVNLGATALTLHLYVTNAVPTAHGGTGFLPEGKAQGGPAGWVTMDFPNHSSTLSLAPHATVIVPITVVIPKNAPPGDHEGAIVASLSSVIQSKNHAKVHFVQQVADRIITRISGDLRPKLSIVGLRVSYDDPLNPIGTNPATLSFTVANTGNVLLGGRVSVSVHGMFGSTETRTGVVSVPIMLPGGSDSARVTVAGVYPEFLMNGKVTIDPQVVTGQYDPGLTMSSAQVSFVAIEWIPLAILILLALLFVWRWVRGRRRRDGAAVAQPGERSPVPSSTSPSSTSPSSTSD